MRIKFLIIATLAIVFFIGCATTTMNIPKGSAGDVSKAYDLYNGLKVKNDYKKALEIASKSCFSQDLDSPYGCFLAGWAYYSAKGTARDYQKALTYFDKGCENKIVTKKVEYDDGTFETKKTSSNSSKSCYMLAKIYEKGLGTEKDYIKSFGLYEKAYKSQIQIFKFPDLKRFESQQDLYYTIKSNTIENSWYYNTPIDIQEQGDMSFFVFNDYILTLKEKDFSGWEGSEDNPFYQIEKLYKQAKDSKNKDLDEKKKESREVQEGNLYSLKFDPKNSYQLLLPAIIKKNKDLDLNKALVFYDYLLKLDKQLPKNKNPKAADLDNGEKILTYAYDDLERMSYMNKGVLYETLYNSSKNANYFQQATLNYQKACDSKYVLGCSFYKNMVDGLSNIPKEL